MEQTLRMHLKKNLPEPYEHEELVWAVQDYYSQRGLEWTEDDEAVLREYGEDPGDYFDFSYEQLMRIEEVHDAVETLVSIMTQRPPHDNDPPEPLRWNIVDEIADIVAERLTAHGYQVWYPTHTEKDGVQSISDIF